MTSRRLGPLKKWIVYLLLVQVFNLSVAVHANLMNPYTLQRDLSINNIDSFFEYLTEDIFGWKNFVKENNVPNQNMNLQKTFSNLSQEYILSKVSQVILPENSFQIGCESTLILPQLFYDITTPPPKSC